MPHHDFFRASLAEREHERRVSAYIGRMSVLWLSLLDEPGPESLRAYIERNAIALLSNGLDANDPPSASWLGRWSPEPRIARTGLWNVNHLEERPDPAFLDVLEDHIHAALTSWR